MCLNWQPNNFVVVGLAMGVSKVFKYRLETG